MHCNIILEFNKVVSKYGSGDKVPAAILKIGFSLLAQGQRDAGISMLWISEATEAPELDYRQIRSRFGPDLGLVGGIPLSVLRSESPEVIRNTLEETIPPLLQTGRYVPLAGGRVREEIPWSVYECYREVLAELMG